MTKRTQWPMVVPSGTKMVGTARVRESAMPPMTAAQRRIFEATGNPPQANALDESDIDDPFKARPVIPQPQPFTREVPKKPSKYRNTKCEHAGIKFDSLKERSRWFELVQRQARGEIRDLRLQVRFELTPRKQRDDGTWERASYYVADFAYLEVVSGKTVVEDVKSPSTRKNPAYVQKRKQMLAVHDITIKEI